MEDFLRDSPFEESSRAEQENRHYSEYDASMPAGDFDFDIGQPYTTTAYDAGALQYTAEASSGMPASEPYFEAFDFLASPTNQPVLPIIPGNNLNPQDLGLRPSYTESFQFNMPNDVNNLDQLVSPDNGAGMARANMFNSAQYFSPNGRQDNFSPLNVNNMGGDQLSKQFLNNTFSPELSRQGSVSVAPSKPELYLLPNAFLSPQLNAYDGLFDTLKSPYLGLYLNSPPPLNLQSTSIPNASNFDNQASISNTLALPLPYGLYGLGASAPSGGDAPRKSADAASNKQLTQEEKVKRRREFHNAVERRRRDLIKEKIKELGVLVPPLLLTPQVCAVQTLQKQPHLALAEIKELLASVKVKETKPNKATILLTSVDYIRHLQYVLTQQERKRQELEQQIAEIEAGESQSSTSTRSDQIVLSSSEFNPDDFFTDAMTERSQFSQY